MVNLPGLSAAGSRQIDPGDTGVPASRTVGSARTLPRTATRMVGRPIHRPGA